MIGTSAFPHVDYTAWREAAERDLKGRDFERALVRRTLSGLHVQPLYTEGPGVGYPGPDSPTRAMTPLGRSQHGWTIVSQPTGLDQTCTLNGGSGTLNGDHETDLQPTPILGSIHPY